MEIDRFREILLFASVIGLISLWIISDYMELHIDTPDKINGICTEVARFKAKLSKRTDYNQSIRLVLVYPLYATVFPPLDASIQENSTVFIEGRWQLYKGKQGFVVDRVRKLD